MIVSHRHRFVFIAVPRTASQSIRAALRPDLDDGDWEQAAWDVQRRLPVPQLAAIGHGHLGVREAENHLPRKLWRDYFKFAVVRDPWDRFLSAAWITRGMRSHFKAQPEVGMALLLRSPTLMSGLHFRPQHSYLERDDGSIGVDFVGRFERLDEDFAAVCDKVGLRPRELPRLNASAREHPANDLQGARAAVEHHYKRDYELFNYRLPGHTRREALEPGDQQPEGLHHP